MAGTTPKFTWCSCGKNKIVSKDSHELCVHCLGIQHAKEAVLQYGKCPHCAKLDWTMRINRLANVQEFMHRENQLQRKCEAARCETPSSPPHGTPEVTKEPIATPSCSTLITLSPAQLLSFPIMLPVNSPPSSLTLPKGAAVSPAGLPQPLHSTFPLSQLSPFPPDADAHKRKHSSRGHSRVTRRPKRGGQHKCQCRSSCWDSTDPSPPVRGVSSWRRGCAVKLERQLMEAVQQKLNAQQKTMQAQWSAMEKRIGALERLTTESLVTVSAATQTVQADQKDCVHPDKATSVQLALKTWEQRHGSGASVEMAGDENGENPSLLPETSLKMKDMLIAAKLQELIGRATKYLGVDFPHATDDPNPIVAPEFEDSVQSTWSNPACSQPFRRVHAQMYQLHECQAPAYDHMPQITSFMSAIFQAVEPMENKEESRPAKSWRFAETLAGRAYQTAGMLARTANYLRYLSDYQKRLLLEVSEGQPPQRFVAIVNELKLIAKFMLQLSSHQAELSGRAMACSVAIRRQVWLAETNCKDDLQATVVDLPFVVSRASGTTNVSTSSNTLCKGEIV